MLALPATLWKRRRGLLLRTPGPEGEKPGIRGDPFIWRNVFATLLGEAQCTGCGQCFRMLYNRYKITPSDGSSFALDSGLTELAHS